MARSLGELFVEAASANPDRPALAVGDAQLSYAELARAAGSIATRLGDRRGEKIAIFGGRTVEAYAAVLGTLLAGAAYVPLSTRSPDLRNAAQVETAECSAILVDEATESRVGDLVLATSRSIEVVRAGIDQVGPSLTPIDIDPGGAAYVMFTSGSTGAPKGVAVSHASALSFIDAARALYRPGPSDRMSQAFELTFDLSLFDLFMALGSGASLHVLSAKEMIAPATFIAERKLTTWFSVPSAGVLMKGFGKLRPGAFPSLRVALFCGERLNADVAAAFAAAAPNARVENLYGPTEATIACTRHVWNAEHSPSASRDGIVPIGRPFGETEIALVDDRDRRIEPGQAGELCLRGPQLAVGYVNDAARTAERFVSFSWCERGENRWYKTGDLALVNDEGELVHLGRVDDQLKIRGYRVEIGEIEGALARASNAAAVAVVGFPIGAIGPTGVVGFVVAPASTLDEVLEAMTRLVPDYMLPSRIVELDHLPLTAHGKVDRSALRRHLEDLDADTD